MPSKELKRTFTGGKQNTDFDERLVPSGETRRLLNGRVARSEGGSVGAVENVRGNRSLSSFPDQAAIVVGSIRDQLDDRIFYFIAGTREDGIYEYRENPPTGESAIRVILRSSKAGVLKFDPAFLITGINLIGTGDEKLLLWTDGLNPPRKVNIDRVRSRHLGILDGGAIAWDSVTTYAVGGEVNLDDATWVALTENIDSSPEADNDNWVMLTNSIPLAFTEEEISVVKKPPLSAPSIDAVQIDDMSPENNTEEDILREQNLRDKFVRFAYRWKYVDDEYSVFSPFSPAAFSVGRFSFDRTNGEITSMENVIRSLDVGFNTGPRDVTEIDLLYKADGSPTVYVVESFVKSDREWRNNIELSQPSNDDDTRTEISINFSSNKLYRALPDRELARVFDNVPITAKAQDIIENRIVYGNYTDRYDLVDILKTFSLLYTIQGQTGAIEGSIGDTTVSTATNLISNIAIGDVIQFNEGVTQYTISAITSSQITITPALDAIVPVGTDITTSERIASESSTESIITLDLEVDVATDSLRSSTEDSVADINGIVGGCSVKTDRDYEIGVVYGDNVGRQSPVLTSENNTVHVPIQRANRRNRLEVDIKSKAPDWATYYRFFVKSSQRTSYNVIPLDSVTQSDDNEFKWFRISDTDLEKVKIGDFLTLKLAEHCFAYNRDDQEKIQFRVEEVGPQERNFLELEIPRVGTLRDDDTGAVVDEGQVVTLQKPGLWMKLRNSNLFGVDIDSTQESSRTQARSNNARSLNNKPIVGNISDYQDVTYYYPGSNISNNNVDDESVTFGGSYTSGTGLSAAAPSDFLAIGRDFGPTGSSPNWGGAGPMRVEVTILAEDQYQVAFFLSPALNEPQVVRQIINLSGTSLPSTGTTVELFNGVNVTFNESPEDYNVGDKFTVTHRVSRNFLWRVWDPTERNSAGGPNGTNRRGFDARRSHIMIPGPGKMEDGINGGSMIQLGVEDGLNGGDNLNGNPITLAFDKNEYLTDNSVYYDNLEEWMFETGLYSGGSEPDFHGTDRNGDNFGIHQCGFWRGLPVPPGGEVSLDDALRVLAGPGAALATVGGIALAGGLSAGLTIAVASGPLAPLVLGVLAVGLLIGIFAKGKNTSSDWRLGSGPPNQILGGTFNTAGSAASSTRLWNAPDAESNALPLYMFVQSGVLNDSSNKKKADPRITSQFSFVQGNGTSEDELFTVPFCFETTPQENVLDVYYEIGDTFKCENGVHYGNHPNGVQRVMTVLPDAAGVETSTVIESKPVTLDYFNCFAFENGIESMSVRDQVGEAELDPGVKASVVLDTYEREENFATLIYSQPFNSTTGLNGLNDFSSADAADGTILKELDESDGTIQKLYAENTNLYVFQEDKVSYIQVDKNSLFNADGSSNVSASTRFLNQTIPIHGEYGISENPESFAVYGSDKYWSDRKRGVILSLNAGNQLTEISEFGMRDFFRDNLENNTVVVGSYDDYHDQYIVSMREDFDLDVNLIALPLLLSRQGFLSRNDACSYPEARLQFDEVYEFYQINEPQGFQVGDMIYRNQERTSIFNGENDWFVWNDRNSGLVATSTNISGTVQTFTYTGTATPPMENQVLVATGITTGTAYESTVSSVTTVGAISTIVVQYPTGTVINALDAVNGVSIYQLAYTAKFVINVDSFGMVRRKLNCLNIAEMNHDAFGASLESYILPQDACGNGIVSRILYHNGVTASPQIGDAIFDTPYGDDEYMEVYQNWNTDIFYDQFDRVVNGNSTWEAVRDNQGIEPTSTATADWVVRPNIPVEYSKGRTAIKDWLQIFDGTDDGDVEDYVIRIVQGEVVERERCARYIQGRTSTNIGRRFTAELPAEICGSIPANTVFHNGINRLPVPGDQLFTNNYSTGFVANGFYSVEGGDYVEVRNGYIARRVPCLVRDCFRDVLNTFRAGDGVLNERINNTGAFTFRGVENEFVFGNTSKQNAANVTIRWSARGSERYPSNPNDFYEFPVTVANEATDSSNKLFTPGEVFALSNPEFITASAGERNLEYSILEFCYDRPLTPENRLSTFYRGTTNSLAGTGQSATAVVPGPYPALFAAQVISDIFDTDGNTVTATIEVRDQIYFDRNATGARVYYTDDQLANVLDGTDGAGNPKWWAFGAVDDMAADQACLINSSGVVLECRDGDNPFDLYLAFDDDRLIACDLGTPYQLYYSDNDDFEMATSVVNIDGSPISQGYYVANKPTVVFDATNVVFQWGTNESFIPPYTIQGTLNGTAVSFTVGGSTPAPPLLDRWVLPVTSITSSTGFTPGTDVGLIVGASDTTHASTEFNTLLRFWEVTTANTGFDPDRFTVGGVAVSTDNCPLSLQLRSRRFSTNEQTLVCSSAPFGNFYFEGGESLMELAASSATIGVFTNRFGSESASPSFASTGFFQEVISNVTRNYTWNSISRTLVQNSVACVITCTDTDADNTGQQGDCTYPTYCSNGLATNFNQLQNGTATTAAQRAKFNSSASAPVCSFATNTITVVNDTSGLITDGTAGDTSGFTVTNTTVSPTSVLNGGNYTVTQGNISIASGFDLVTAPTLTVSDPGSGTANSNITVTATYAGSVTTTVVVPEPEPEPVGCSTIGADNYNSISDGTAQCYYGPTSYLVGSSDVLACDGFNSGGSSRSSFYHTTAGAPETIGTILYTKSGDDYTRATTSGWLTSDGGTAFEISSGAVTSSAVGCLSYPRISGLGFTSTTTSITAGSEFSFQVRWTGAAAGQVYYVVVSSSETIGTEEGDVGEALNFRGTVFHRPSSDSSFRLTATVYFGTNASGAVAGTVNSDRIEVESTIGGGGAF